jgi:CHAD domain-containing protein
MLEHEIKFAPGPWFEVPDLTGVAGVVQSDAPDTLTLEASYYDTDDLRIVRSGASLRYRSDGGWTVKVPLARDDALTREEVHVDGAPGEPPDGALDLVRAIARSAPVHLVAQLNTVRTRVVLRDGGGRELAEVDDDEVSVVDGTRLAARFRELEVEFAEDAPDEFVAAVTARLRAAGAGQPDPVPKVVRALGPRAAEPPDVLPVPELDRTSTAIDVVRAAIASGTQRLLVHDPVVRKGSDAEGVHQARVATRRLRSDLRTFDAVLDASWTESLRDELGWLGDLLGAVRDDDVLLERLDGRIAELPAADGDDGKQLLDALSERREHSRAELLEAMRSPRYLALLDRLVDASCNPVLARDADVDDLELADFARRPWRKLRKAVRALEDDPGDHELHRVRIRAKRARYAAEAVAPVFGKRAKEFARAMADVQDVLGEHQDAVVAGEWLRAHAAGAGAFVAGELVATEREAARAARDEWPRVWARGRRKRLRRWMKTD